MQHLEAADGHRHGWHATGLACAFLQKAMQHILSRNDVVFLAHADVIHRVAGVVAQQVVRHGAIERVKFNTHANLVAVLQVDVVSLVEQIRLNEFDGVAIFVGVANVANQHFAVTGQALDKHSLRINP